VQHAYALLAIKQHEPERRTFSGIASTPTPDRSGDIFDALGAVFHNPLPLLLHHDKSRPVGRVTLHQPTKDGIGFSAEIPSIAEPGALKDRVDEAWQSIKAGLLTGVSIGYRILDGGIERRKGADGLLIKSSEICELSLVTVPANVEATIHNVKSLDAPFLTASGHHPSGVADRPVVRAEKAAQPMNTTTTEQIKAFEATRKTKLDRMQELMTKAAEQNVTLDADQTAEYDGLKAEVDSIDAHLVRLKAHEQMMIATATPIVAGNTPRDGELRGGAMTITTRTGTSPIISVKSTLPAGHDFVRTCMAMVACKGVQSDALHFAEKWKDSSPRVIEALRGDLRTKTAVPPGTATDPAWAGPLVPMYQTLAAEFMEYLRPATIIGKIENLRRVPFHVRVPMQTSTGVYGWVGEDVPKPVAQIAFTATTLSWAKIAGLIIFTQELARVSSPDAETIFRNDMVKGIAQFMDSQFVDPTVAGTANVSPASITNGTTPITTVNSVADVQALIAAFVAAYIPVGEITFILSEQNAVGLSLQRIPVGGPLWPDVKVTGGTLAGVPLITSQAVGSNFIAVAPTYILYADDGGVTIDVSQEASVIMDTAPAGVVAPPTWTSLWQNNLIGLRAERYCNWVRAKLQAVKYVSGAAYMGSTPATLLAETPNAPHEPPKQNRHAA
jgi:HK97 family phage major capsid protein/HK97 family phage prohead protease